MGLPFDAKVSLLEKLVEDYNFYKSNGGKCPKNQTFRFISSEEGVGVDRAARIAALSKLCEPAIKKVAFDTRRIDQEKTRNPRTNLQYWHRAQPFIDEEDNHKLNVFAKLLKVVEAIKADLGTDPEWFESYARVLHDNLNRILRIKQADLDIFRPQLSYLEQLIYARYRLTMESISKLSDNEIREQILAKDENLLKRGEYIKRTGGQQKQIVIDGNSNNTQQSIINAIFGNNNLRKDGERTVERVITISIKDNVID